MIAVDTNILVYAHRSDADWHEAAAATMRTLAEGRVAWGIPWPCVHEFLAIATHPRIYSPPSTLQQAIDQVDAWLNSPSVIVFGEAQDHWNLVKQALLAGKIRGPTVHDARIAAICEGYGVTEFLSADRDFSRFVRLTTRNPLIDWARR